jgi:hypothetical protein
VGAAGLIKKNRKRQERHRTGSVQKTRWVSTVDWRRVGRRVSCRGCVEQIETVSGSRIDAELSIYGGSDPYYA